MVRLTAVLFALALAAVLSFTAVAEDEEPTVLVAVESGKYSFRIPSSWKPLSDVEDEGVFARWYEVPGAPSPIRLALFDIPGVTLSARSQALLERPRHAAREKVTSSEFRMEPLSHLVVRREREKGEFLEIFAFTRIRGHGLNLRLSGYSGVYDTVYEAFLRTALTIEAEVDYWPEPPKDYEEHLRKQARFYLAHDVSKRAIAPIEKILKAALREFEGFHGALERPEDEPLTVVIAPTRDDIKALSTEIVQSDDGDGHAYCERRVYALPLPKSHGRKHANLRSAFVEIFLCERYRTQFPYWIHLGERWIAKNAEWSKRKGPVVPQQWYDAYEIIDKNLDELEPLAAQDWARYEQHANVYVLLFRHGPRKYDEAYRAFLEAVDRGGDPQKALETTLFALDQNQMRRDAHFFLADKAKRIVLR